MNRHQRHKASALVILLVTGLVVGMVVLSACGSDSTAPGSPSPANPAASPSQAASAPPRGPGTIAFTQNTRHGEFVCLIDTNGTGFKRLATGSRPAWSPDGSRIAYLADTDLMVMNADGSDQRSVRTFSSRQRPSTPAWSPDGRRLALTIHELPWDELRLVVVDGDGTDYRDVIPPSKMWPYGSPCWAPDGRIFFLRVDKGVTEVCSVKPDGSDLAVVTPAAEHASGLSLSPDGVWLALYESPYYDPRARGLLRLLASGHGREMAFVDGLSRHVRWIVQAASSWSPRGSRVALAASPCGWFGGSALYIANAFDGSVRRVPHTGEVFDPAWRPQ